MPTFKNCKFIGVDKRLLVREVREVLKDDVFENCTFFVDKDGSAVIIEERKKHANNLWSKIRQFIKRTK